MGDYKGLIIISTIHNLCVTKIKLEQATTSIIFVT